MKKWIVLITMSGLFLAATASRADLLVPPRGPTPVNPPNGPAPDKSAPQEVALDGKLSWERLKQPDGTEKNGKLLLTRDNGSVVALGVAGQLKAAKPGETIDADKFIGKQVNVTVMARFSRPGTPVISVEQIVSIKEAAKPAGP